MKIATTPPSAASPPSRSRLGLGPCVLVALGLALAGCGDPSGPETGSGARGAGTGTGTPATDRRPDLVLVVVDTLRADHLSTYGYARPTAPGLDGLAAGGAVFLDNTSQSSWTLPSVASLLSGRRLFVNAQRMPPGVPTLAERLAQAGYETAAFIGNPALSGSGGYDRGFEAFIGRETTGNVTWDAPDLAAALRGWLSAHPPGERPRFLYLHFMDPHFPYAPRGGADLAGEVVIPDDTLAAWVTRANAEGKESPYWQHFDEDRRHVLAEVDRYDREVATVDATLAELLPELRAARAAADGDARRETLFVFAADHGEMLWDHEHHPKKIAELPPDKRTLREVFFRDHSYHMFQQLVHTPLVASGPGIPAGQRSEVPVENVDIVPTLLRAAGLPDDPALDGRALQDVLAGRARPRAVISAFANEATLMRRPDVPWKLVFPTATGDDLGMPMQLYRLDTDPRERHNLAGEAQPGNPALDALRGLIRLREDAAAAFHLYDGADAGNADPEHQRVLQELGYIGGADDRGR